MPRRRPRTVFHSGSRSWPSRRATCRDARLPPGTTTVSNTSRSVSQASATPISKRTMSQSHGGTNGGGAKSGARRGAQSIRLLLDLADPLSRWAAGLRTYPTTLVTRHEQAPGHEDSQFFEVAQVAPPGLPSHPPPRPHLRHQQDEPPVQGSPGLRPCASALRFQRGITT